MLQKRNFLLALLVFSSSLNAAFAQDLTNKGKDFWICYPDHIDGTNSAMGVYITSDVNATGLIDVAGTVVPFTVVANTVTYKFIGPGASGSASNIPPYLSQQDGIKTGAGIHVTSDKDVAVYAHIIRSARSGATLVLPTKVWGKEYMLPSYRHNSATGYGELVVMASLPNTIVEITPAVLTRSGRPAGVPFQITLLNPGDVYQLQFANTLDLSGTRVKSLPSGGIGCLPIAVYSATTFTSMGCSGANSGDNLLQQIFPTGAWGKQFLTSPLKRIPTNTADLNTDIIRVFVNDPTTVVNKTENGITNPLTGLIANTYYEYTTALPTFLDANKPIQVVEYIATQVCGNPQTQSDPEMIVLNAVEQTINDITVFSAHQNFVPPGQSQVTNHYLNVIMKTVNTPFFKINGAVPAASFIAIPGTSYSYLKEDITIRAATNPVSRLTADSGFSAIAYGFGNVESYGYNAGTNVKDLYQQIGVVSTYGIETTPSVCSNSPFKFKVSLPYIPDSMYWNFNATANMFPNNTNVFINNIGNVAMDSSTIVNGRTIYWYSLPTLYSFSVAGTYPIKITTYVPNGDCGTQQEINFDLIVNEPPVANFTWVAGGCLAEPVAFNETTPQTPKPTYRWWWDFGDPGSGAANNSNLRNPVHTFSAPGTFNVRFVSVTTPGCLTDTLTHTVTVLPLPGATIAANTSVCINGPQPVITFTGSGGTAPYTFSYTINAGPVLTVNSAGTTATVMAPTTTVGTFTYTLVSVKNTGSTLCTNTISGQTAVITVLPDHTISLSSAPSTANQTVCINTPIVPITYTLGGGATGGNVTGLPAGITSSVSGTTLTISGTPTTTTGSPFAYSITTTGNACVTASINGTITVLPDHTITLSSATSTTNQAVCQSSNIQPVIYNLAGGATGATVTGLPPGVTANVAGGVLTISGAPATATGSPFSFSIITTGNNCITASASGTITVYQLPTGGFTYTVPACNTRTISFTDASSPNNGTLTGWLWNFGDPASGAANTSILTNPDHSFAAAGNYTVSLTLTTSLGCSNLMPYTQVVTLNDRPKAGYIVPSVCLSDTYAQFLDTSSIAAGSITAWSWNFGDPVSGINNTSMLTNPQHSYTSVGLYNVNLIVMSNAGCKDSVSHVLSVNGSFPVANFTVNNPSLLCANDSVSITNISTVFPGNVTRLEIYWDNTGFPAVYDVDNTPAFGRSYKHLYPIFQSPLTKTFTIRFRAFSGGVCVNEKTANITVNAAPRVQFNAIPDTCLLSAPFQLTQASEIGAVPGSGVYSGPGTTASGIFNAAAAGVGLHTILFTYTSSAGSCVDTMSRTIRVLDTARAFFTYILPACDGVPLSFTEQSSAPSIVVLNNSIWNFGDGTPVENHAPGSTFTHLFPAAGTYTVSMYNTSAYGCSSTIYAEMITIDSNHTVTLTSVAGSNNQTVCINTAIVPITFRLGGGAAGATVSGLPAGLNASVSGNILTISGSPTTTAGSPFAFSILTTGNNCITATANGSITVNPDHTIQLNNGPVNQRVCLFTPITPVSYILGGSAVNATVLNLPPGVIKSVSGNILTISGTPTSTAGSPYNFIISTIGNACLTASAIGSITVSPLPVPLFATDKAAYCIPNAIIGFNNLSTIEDGTENTFTYLWDFGDQASGALNTSTAKSPNHYFSTVGPYSVYLKVTSGVGCVHDTSIVVTSIHPQPKADFNITKASVCIKDSVTFIDRTDYKDGVAGQFHWDMGDGTIKTFNPVNYTYTDTATFNVVMYTINNFGCNSDTVSKPFTVYPFPKVNAGPDRFILEGGSIVIESVTFANDPQYLWTPNRYLVNNTVARPRAINLLTDMTYTLTVTGLGGCSLSDDMFVKLLKFPIIPNTFTPNNDGINDQWRIDYLSTYPDNRVQVFTRTGQLVFESKGYGTPWDGTLKGKPLPFDTYYYIIEPGSGRDPITGYVTIIR